MAGAERPGEPHGRRRSAGPRRRDVPDRRGALNGEGRAPSGDTGGAAGYDGALPGATGHARAPAASPESDGGADDAVLVTGGDTSGEAGENARGGAENGHEGRRDGRRAIVTYMRANPQVFVLLVICVVLGVGTFLAVVFGLLTAGSGQTTGEPSGAILGVHALEHASSWLML